MNRLYIVTVPPYLKFLVSLQSLVNMYLDQALHYCDVSLFLSFFPF
jgi:hypothetical protein